mmetsp:Transcript_16923/g.21414  ORF Transcript_16923/g.21414 Transcript_16923/m.21414 type:complete len:293 (-) Transcript_16923:178-1056(-)
MSSTTNKLLQSSLTRSSKSSKSNQSHFSSSSNSKDSGKGGTFSPPTNNSSFLSLFEKQKWKAIRNRLKSRKAAQFVRATGCFGISTLALALGHNAPLEIVETILDLDPTLALQKDVLGASPLHIACLNGAPLHSIKLLVQRYPHLVPDRDSDLRTPLHHAVEFICRMDNGVLHQDQDSQSMLDIVKELISVSPDTIHWTDKHGDSPLDLTHIIMIETDSSSFTEDESTFRRVEQLYRFLKKESIKTYLRNKKKWEQIGFDTTVRKNEATSKTQKSFGTATTEDTSCNGSRSR